jgi:hypothetical protein
MWIARELDLISTPRANTKRPGADVDFLIFGIPLVDVIENLRGKNLPPGP